MKIEIEGLKEFRRELKRIDSELGKELRRIHLGVSQLVASRAQAAAPGRLSGSIRPAATQKAALIRNIANPPDALAQIWGAKRRSGWYAASRYAASAGRQFRPWVGNQWDPGERGGSPYFIGEAINASVEDVIEMIGDAFEKTAAKAFPNR